MVAPTQYEYVQHNSLGFAFDDHCACVLRQYKHSSNPPKHVCKGACRSANALLELPREKGTLPAGSAVSALLIADLTRMPVNEEVAQTTGGCHRKTQLSACSELVWIQGLNEGSRDQVYRIDTR